jgi:hypothetical protein
VSVTISIGSTGDAAGEIDNEASIVKDWSRSAGEMSCKSMGDDGSSLVIEETVEPDGDEKRFDELERFRWLYLFFAASAVRPGK